ncbi:MAG: Histidine kinase [Betaproteobacteria bacterium]|nr:Histidine kinase [Betaproteobacteria bacterium]
MRDESKEGATFHFAGSNAADAPHTAPASTERVTPVANLLDLIHDAFFVRSMGGVIHYWNRAAEELYGWTADEAVGRVSHELLKTVFPAPLAQIEAELLRAGRWEGELVHTRKDGSEVTVASRWSLQRDERALPTAIVETNNDITARRRAEEALQEREWRYRHIFHTAGVSIWDEDFSRAKAAIDELKARGVRDFRAYLAEHPEFVAEAVSIVRIVDVNDATLRLFAADSKQELVESLHKVFVPETHEVFANELIAIAEGRTYFEGETTLRTLKGEPLTVLFTMTFPPPPDSLNSVLVTVTDITERNRAEEQRLAHVWILESMDRINRAMQGTNDLEQMMSDVLDAVLEIFGADRAWLVYPCDPEAASWRAAMEHTRPEFPGIFTIGTDLPIDTEIATVFRSARACAGAVLFGPEYDLQVPALVAERFSIQSQMAIAIYPKVDQPYLFGLHQCSRTRVWKAQEKRLFEAIGRRLADALTSLLIFRSLRESERKLEEAQRIAHVGHWERNFETGRVTLSDETCLILGVQPQEVPSELAQWRERWFDIVHPNDRTRLQQALESSLETGEPYDVEYRVVRSNDDARIVHSRAHVARDETGRPRRIFGMTQDITDLRRAEEELRKQAELLSLAHDAIIVRDAESRITFWNPGAEKTYGWSAEEAVGRMSHELLQTRFPVSKQAVAAVLEQQGEWEGELTHITREGTTIVVTSRQSRRRGERGAGAAILEINRDITERKQAEAERAKLEERLRQAEKMEAIGRFASGIAHDFNNVLGGIVAYGEMLFDEAPEEAARKRYARNVLTAATRGRDLVDQILAYSRSQRGRHVPTDVCRTVAETLELLRSSLPARISLYPKIPDVPLVVLGDATQLHQIVMNLCSNSIHAMKAGGPLRVAITPLDAAAERVLSHGNLSAGRYVCTCVEDSGCGMDEATLAHIFEPFFTTKEIGRGTGLGLALVYAIVVDLGGAIDVKSVPDEGSTFSIYLPLADVTAAAAAAAA